MKSNHSISGLYVLVGDTSCYTAVELARMALLGGASVIQLRQKGVDPSLVSQNSRAILDLKKEFSFTFILNDDPEMAHEVQADGVHLGQGDMSVTAARKILGPDKIIGKSTHSLQQAQKALQEDIHYIACGAVFPSPTKNAADHPVIGLAVLEKIASISSKPVVAIGGITRKNAASVIQAGASALAVISAVTQAEDGEEEVRYFSSLFQR